MQATCSATAHTIAELHASRKLQDHMATLLEIVRAWKCFETC